MANEDPLAGFVSNPPEPLIGETTDQGRVTSFVPGPLGTVVPVPEGMTSQQVLEQIRDRANEDPKFMGLIRGLEQARKGGNLESTTPEFRRAYFAKQLEAAVEPGDIEDFFFRMDLARSRSLTTKMAKFREAFPDSEVKVISDVDESPVLMFRHPGDFAFREMEAPEINMGDLAALMGGTIDETTMGELTAFLATRGTTSILKNMVKGFVGAATGEAVKSRVETDRGFGEVSGGPLVERMIESGGAAAVGVGLFDVGARIINYIRGVKGLVAPLPKTAEVGQFAERAGFPKLLPGSVHPLYESMQQQATGTSLLMKGAVQDVFAQTIAKLGSIKDEFGSINDLTDDVLELMIARSEKGILASLGTRAEMTFANMGRKVQAGLDNFVELLSTREGRLYAKAFRESTDAKYIMDPAKKLAASIKLKIPGGFNFSRISTKVHVPLVDNLSPELRTALDLIIREPGDIILQKQASPLERMIRHRERFFNLKDNPTLSGEERAAATAIHKTLTGIMFHPFPLKGKGLASNVIKLWRTAASHTRARHRFMSKAYVRIATQSDTPTQLAKKLSLDNPDGVIGVKRIFLASGQRDRWVSVQQAFEQDLLKRPKTIRGKFEGAVSKDGLDALVRPERQKILLKISDDFNILEKGTVKKLLSTGLSRAEKVIRLLGTGSGREIRDIIKEAGGRNTPEGGALQAGVFELLLTRSTRKGELGPVIDRKLFNNWMKRFRDRGILAELFDEKTLKRVEDIDDYIAVLPKNMGVGEGMQKASIGADLGAGMFPVTPGNIWKFVSGVGATTKNRMIAWAFTSEGSQKFLIGKGLKPGQLSPGRLDAIGGLIGLVVKDINDLAESGSLNLSGEAPDLFSGPSGFEVDSPFFQSQDVI